MDQKQKFSMDALLRSLRACTEEDLSALAEAVRKAIPDEAQILEEIPRRDMINALIDYAEEDILLVMEAFQEVLSDDAETIKKYLTSAGNVPVKRCLTSGKELRSILAYLTDSLPKEEAETQSIYCRSLCRFLDALEQNSIQMALEPEFVDPALDRHAYEQIMTAICEELVQRQEGSVAMTPVFPAEAEYPGGAEEMELADLEGAVLSAPLPIFLRRMDHSADRYALYFGRLSDGEAEVPIPYKELFGSPEAGIEEYAEDKNLEIAYEDWTVCLKDKIADYEDRLEREYEKGAQAGYDPESSPPILCLSRMQTGERSLTGPWHAMMRMTFGQASYYEHRLYREEIQQLGSEAERAFLQVLKQGRGVTDFIRHPLWGNSGGGVWILTKDNYLLVSFRNSAHVLEEQGKLSYGSSGCFDRYLKRSRNAYHGVPYSPDAENGTPAKNMMHEINEEIGIPLDKIPASELVQISMGIDVARFLMQFSYFWRSPFTREDIIFYRSNEAVTAMEQQVFFIPFEKESIDRFLQTCEFEPGAAFSLMRIRQKYLEGEAGV